LKKWKKNQLDFIPLEIMILTWFYGIVLT